MTASRLDRFLRRVDGWIRARLAERRDGVVPFFDGRFVASADRAGLVARTFYEGAQLSALIDHHFESDPPDSNARAVDIGCGYGRLTPFLRDSPHIDSVHGVEPNEYARTRAAELYPFATFSAGVAEDIPYPDDHFGLAIAWTVLQHVDDRNIERVASELSRVVVPGGYLITCDKTTGTGTEIIHPRRPRDYIGLLDDFESIDTRERALEPGNGHDGENTVMVFRRTDR